MQSADPKIVRALALALGTPEGREPLRTLLIVVTECTATLVANGPVLPVQVDTPQARLALGGDHCSKVL